MSVLLLIQPFWHSDGIPEIIFLQKVNFEKNQMTKKAYKITQHAKS